MFPGNHQILKVTNVSQQKVMFKVKMTQTSWYDVRPNQQILDIGQTEDIAIVLVEAECKLVDLNYFTTSIRFECDV